MSLHEYKPCLIRNTKYACWDFNVVQEVVPVAVNNAPNEEVPRGVEELLVMVVEMIDQPQVNVPVITNVRPQSVDNLLRKLDEAIDNMYQEGKMSPNPSSCTSLRLINERLLSSLVEIVEYCTCDWNDGEVTSRIDVDENIQIWCCGQFRSLRHVCCH